MLRRPCFLFASVLILASCVVGQGTPTDKQFTILVAGPTSAKDVQIRYFINGEFGTFFGSSTTSNDSGKLVIKTQHESKPATSFKAIAYAPGCQFVTISVEDLAASDRQATFNCQALPTTLLQGRVPTSALGGKDLQVEVLYVPDWAPKYFAIGSGAFSPFSLTKVTVATDGSFAVDMPDFSTDPTWSSLSNQATLRFSLVDKTGTPVHQLAAPQGNNLKVANSYPVELQFTVGAE